MFEEALKGTGKKNGKLKKWGAFGNKDANRWKKEGSVASMKKLKKGKVKVW